MLEVLYSEKYFDGVVCAAQKRIVMMENISLEIYLISVPCRSSRIDTSPKKYTFPSSSKFFSDKICFQINRFADT